jgi:type III secretion protein SpaR/YscT/HrcT
MGRRLVTLPAAPNIDTDYFATLANQAMNGHFNQVFSLFFLSITRLLPIMAQAPFLGARILPNPVKLMLAGFLWVMFLPTFAETITTPLQFDLRTLFLSLKELTIGMMLGFFISIPFNLMQSVGFLIDHQRGAASLMVNDPSIQNQTSPLGLLFNNLLIYLFYMVNGPFYFFEVINESYALMPPDHFLLPAFFSDQNLFWQALMGLMNNFMALTIQLAAPSLIIILMTDFFLGIANRLAPQVQIIFLGMGLKSTIPIVVLALGWYLFLDESTKQSILWVRKSQELVEIMGVSKGATEATFTP